LEKQLLEIINPIVWRGDSFDRWYWVDEKTETYTVQSCYWAMKAILDIPTNDCLRKLWSVKVPGTTKMFGWRVWIDRLPSKINLEKRGVKLPCNLCPLCNKDAKSIQHIMLSCEVTQRL